jgi:CRP-like cAMP-binding protein
MPADFLTLIETYREPRAIEIAAGRSLFRRGDVVYWLHVVRAGRVHLSRLLETGTEIALAHLTPGEIVAEASIYAPRYHCDAVAELDCRLDRFAIAEVRAVLEREPKAASAYGAYLARRVMDLRAISEIRSIRRADERLLAWIRLRAVGENFESSGNWTSVAREIGLTSESIYRALAKLEHSRRIARRGSRVTIPSHATT